MTIRWNSDNNREALYRFRVADLPGGNLQLSIDEIKLLICEYEQDLPKNITKRFGHCFVYAFDFFFNNIIAFDNPDCKLVHGYLTQNNNKVIGHAWLRLYDHLYDPVFGTFEIASRLSNNYKPVWSYSAMEAIALSTSTNHTGPWQPLPKDKTL